MIDRIRQDIQERLDQLLAEADRLREALNALGGEPAAAPARSSRADGASTRTRSASRARGTGGRRAGSARAAAARESSGASTRGRSRGAAGGTKNAVLKALSDSGSAMTAGEVAAATGLGRASVSTTLSKLARSGEVNKADRGYQLGNGQAASASGQNSQ